MDQRVRHDLADGQLRHGGARGPDAVGGDHLRGVHVPHDPVEGVVEDLGDRADEVPAVDRPCAAAPLDGRRQRQMREQALGVLAQRVQAGGREPPVARHDVHAVEDHVVVHIGHPGRGAADRGREGGDQVGVEVRPAGAVDRFGVLPGAAVAQEELLLLLGGHRVVAVVLADVGLLALVPTAGLLVDRGLADVEDRDRSAVDGERAALDPDLRGEPVARLGDGALDEGVRVVDAHDANAVALRDPQEDRSSAGQVREGAERGAEGVGRVLGERLRLQGQGVSPVELHLRQRQLEVFEGLDHRGILSAMTHLYLIDGGFYVIGGGFYVIGGCPLRRTTRGTGAFRAPGGWVRS